MENLANALENQCDGYIVPGGVPNSSHTNKELKSAPPNGKLGSAQCRPNLPGLLLLANPSLGGLGSHDERRSFEFFRSRTATQLSGFFASELWERSILQASHHEPAIRHAVIALGCLHQRFENGHRHILKQDRDTEDYPFALKQYNLAIKHLVKPAIKGQQAIDVCLIACVLFCCFEVGHL